MMSGERVVEGPLEGTPILEGMMAARAAPPGFAAPPAHLFHDADAALAGSVAKASSALLALNTSLTSAVYYYIYYGY